MGNNMLYFVLFSVAWSMPSYILMAGSLQNKIDKQNYLNVIIQQEVSSGPALMIYKKEQKTYEIK